jgi:hypothetical protein
MFESLQALVNTKGFAKLPTDTRSEIIGALADHSEPKPA